MTTANTSARSESPSSGGVGEASYFTIEEMISSATALREGIDNRPNKCAYHLLHVLVDQLLDPIREAWGEPIVVSSGYRCKELNALVGGAKNSHHMLGCAADIIAGNKADHRRLFYLIQQMQQEGKIRFTQLIAEEGYRWLHISYVPGMLRNQVIDVNVDDDENDDVNKPSGRVNIAEPQSTSALTLSLEEKSALRDYQDSG